MSEIDKEQQGMTDQEIKEQEDIRAAELEAKIQPYRALAAKIEMSFQANVDAGNITPEDIVKKEAVFTPEAAELFLNKTGGKTL